MTAIPAPRPGWELLVGPEQVNQRRCKALRAYLYEDATLQQAAGRVGYAPNTVSSLVRNPRAGKLIIFAPPGVPGRAAAPRKDVARARRSSCAARACRSMRSAPGSARKGPLWAAPPSLWRGEPMADVHADYVLAARARLTDRRLTAVERLAELEFSLGRHEDLIEELAAELAAHPIRERLAGHLMLALHRSGRQADALSVARGLRSALADQRGLDPGSAFISVEHAILKDDPALTAGVPEPPAITNPPSRPSYLPYDVPDFTGRTAKLGRIAATGPGTICAIDGMPGVGKTTFAVHAARRAAGKFPDGQLFVDLRAYTPGQEPLAAETALEILLRQLGIEPDSIPASIADRAALWQAELADRKALVVVDNVADTDHVRSLLPSAPSCLFLITSRRRLIDLDGAQSCSMGLFLVADAVELFTRIVGDRAAAEREAVLDVLVPRPLLGANNGLRGGGVSRWRRQPRETDRWLRG